MLIVSNLPNKDKEQNMCPCLSSKNKYAICRMYDEGLMVPSLFERENYCFAVYELCPFFGHRASCHHQPVKERELELISNEAL